VNDRKGLGRKLRKLRTSPRQFISDSKHPAFRLLHAVMKTGWPDGERERASLAAARAPSGSGSRPAPSNASTQGLSPRQLVEKSGLFDAAFYISKYEDMRRKGVKDPLEHYLRYGAAELRHPNPLFDPRYYAINARIDPADAPLLHYLREGERKGFSPHPTFEPGFYLLQNPDVAASGVGALSHYLRFGRNEGRQARESLKLTAGIALGQDLRLVNVTILIPVFNNAEHVRRCIESVLANTSLPQAELLLVDDASTEAATRELLDRYAALPKVTLLRNEENLGFTRSVNRGLRFAAGRDVVLLNSDTVVAARWLETLTCIAYGSSSIATATPLSDNAGAFSTPKAPSNDTDAIMPVHDAARLSARAASDEAHFVPTGNGFCMYMRRAAIDDVGLLDEENFPRGYGEENDWCMRAGERGWRHAISLRSYVRHVNAVSFGSEAKEQLRSNARLALDRLHPDYGAQIKRAFTGESALTVQRHAMGDAVDQLRKKSTSPPRPRVLFVLSTRDGGTPATNEDLMRGVMPLYEPLLLVCDSRELKLFDCSGAVPAELCRQRLSETVPFVPHTSAEYDRVVAEWMLKFGVELLHVRHIAWHSLGLVRAAKRLCIPVVFSFHDFYTMCPSVNLTNGKDAWCEDGVTSPHIHSPLWDTPIRDLAGVQAVQAGDAVASLAVWQRRMNAMLAECDAFVTTSPTVKAILSKNLPVLRERAADFHIIPHGRDFDRFLPPPVAPSPSRPLRVLLLGNITNTKGLATIIQLLELDEENTIELHTMGKSHASLSATQGIHHGPYPRAELLQRIEAVAPDVGIIPTICPETFCHTLSECWAAGLPVVGSELGAVGERIRDSGAGWTVDPRDARQILHLLRRIREGREDWASRAEAVRAWQRTVGTQSTVSAMAGQYIDVYQNVSQRRRPLLPEAGRQGAHLGARKRVAVVVKGHFPNSLPTAHVRLGTSIGQASGESIDYDWVDAAELVSVGVRDFDGVVVCRNGDERPAVLSHLARQCQKHHVPLVLDLDDDLLNVPPEKDPTLGYLLIRPALIDMLGVASMLTASTESLAKSYAPMTRSVRVVPNRLDPRIWLAPPEEAQPPPELDPDAPFRVLYMGSPTHHEDLELISGAFSRLHAAHGVQLHTIGVTGAKPPAGVVAIRPPFARYDHFIRWFRSVTRYFDAAVAPLVDSSFNRCKSDLKFLEYAACGLPVVTSRVVPYVLTVRDGEDGLLADNDEESWFQAIASLVEQPELRARLGAAARLRAQTEFMATSCVYDELPWEEWRAGMGRKPSAENGKAHARPDVEHSLGAWGA
jgi:GT2 family glycosyltransferase/glycosyltransferase involved in cell wall biosynthesis